jgi:hypothetical protein
MDPNFNWEFYLYANPDLNKEYILSENDAIEHFNKYGQYENRKYKLDLAKNIKNFNQYVYFFYNQDIFNNLHNLKETLFHYEIYGHKKKTIYTIEEAIKKSNFNWIAYLYKNQDLLLENILYEKEAFNHFLKIGIINNLDFNIDIKILNYFNCNLYLLLYDDLAYIDNYKDALIHYIKYGIDEKRTYDIILNNIFSKINIKKYNKKYNIIENNNIKKKDLNLFYFNHWNKIGKYKKYIFNNYLSENKINSNFGLAVSLYIDDNTSKERIMATYICLNSLIIHFIKNKIILVIDYKINDALLNFIYKLSKKYTNIDVYRNNNNYGIAKTKNICIKLLEKYDYLDYYCLIDDDIEIIDNFEKYVKNIYEKIKIPIISNFNNDLKYKEIQYENIDLIYTKNYFGNILVIHKDELLKKGYFNKFTYNWGYEHIEITNRYLNDTTFQNNAISFKNYFNNSQIINNINTLHLHSLKINTTLVKQNKLLLNQYNENNTYVHFLFDEDEITKLTPTINNI